MSSREDILKRVKANKPQEVVLPDLSVFKHNIDNATLIEDFIKTATANISTVVNLVNEQINLATYLPNFIRDNFGENCRVFNTLAHPEQTDFKNTHVDLFITKPEIAVAENGCMWVNDELLVQRIASFASENTLFIVDHTCIVPTMHQAYEKISINKYGYGVFIAGPSKTADIEQSLVVGAQGAVSNTVILV